MYVISRPSRQSNILSIKNSYLMKIHLSLNIWLNINGWSQQLLPTLFDGEKKKKNLWVLNEEASEAQCLLRPSAPVKPNLQTERR